MSQQMPSTWDSSEVAESWKQETEQRQQLMAEATQRMLEAAQIGPGDRVLDIAAGTGDQSILAARIVGPDGSVLATDLSSEMLKIAADLAQQEGLTTITTRVMDAQQLTLEDATFDAAISRYGLMLMPQPQKALSEVWRVLKPGKKFAALVWSRPEQNPLFSLPLNIIAKYLDVPLSGISNIFSLADPAIFEQAFTEAGFRDVVTSTIQLHFHYASLEAFLQTRRRMLGGPMQQVSEQDRQQMMAEVKQALHQFEGPEGFAATGEVLLGVGTK